MNIFLACSQCEYRERSSAEKELMNKIIMWNHIKRAHPRTAERLMRQHEIFPDGIFSMYSLQTQKI